MLKDITIGQYVPGESFVHKLDPRTKIIISFLFIISLFLIERFFVYGLVVLFLGGVILDSKIPIKFILRGLKPIVILVLITACLNMLMTKGSEDTLIFNYGIISIYLEGINLALFMACRIIFLIIGASLLTLTTSTIEFTDGIEFLLKPIGKNISHEIAMMMSIAIRFIPSLTDEADKIMRAQKARGADFENGRIFKRAKSMVPILIPLFVNSFKRADELALAMEARCYRGAKGRTRLRKLQFSKKDILAFIIFGIFFTAIILTRIFF